MYVRMMTVALSFALFVTFMANSLDAQQRGGGRGGQQPRTGAAAPARQGILPPEFDNRPFDIAIQQLPPRYLGCDAELVYTRIKNGKETSKKGEFEGTEGPRGGAERQALLPLAKTLDLGSTYAFRYNPEERIYDTHERILHVYCPLSAVLENGKENETRRGLRVKYQPRVDNKHIGTDASGKKVEFEELKFREYLVAFANFGEFPVERITLPSMKQAAEKDAKKGAPGGSLDERLKPETITANIHVTPKDTEQLEESIAMLVVCELVEPYIASDTVQQIPTPEKPRDYLAQYYYLSVRLLELWFYDFDTGKVLMKMKPGQASRLQ